MSCRALRGREEGRSQYKVAAPLPPLWVLCAPHCKVLSRLASLGARRAPKGASVSGCAIKTILMVSYFPYLLIY